MNRPIAISLAVALLVAACSDSGGPSTGGTEPAASAQFSHDFGDFTLAPLQEIADLCISWTLRNEKPLYVNGVTVSNGGGYHHSNWFVVPEDQYPGPDGFFDCDERGFAEVAAAVAGTVIFAQSTQSQIEEQKLAAGAVIKIPPHHKIMADVHVLNLSNRPHTTDLIMSLALIHPRDVTAVMTPFRLSYLDLHIPPKSEAHFTGDCDLASVYQQAAGKPLDLKLYWVLPHYHYLGNYFRVQVIGGPRDGEVIHGLDSFNAEANGKALDPPLDLTGARGLRFTCGYGNPRDTSVEWGIGDQEMCVMLGFADSAVLMDASVVGENHVDGLVDGVVRNSGPCVGIGLQKNAAQTMPGADEIAAELYIPPGGTSGPGSGPDIIPCVDTSGNALAEPPATLSSIRENILNVSCVFSACHDSVVPAGGLDLASDGLRERLLAHPILTARTDLSLVQPGDPEGSWLYYILSRCEPEDDTGRRLAHMPRNSPALLDPTLVAKVRAWIASGAADN